mgnify:CR=1 FL=1
MPGYSGSQKWWKQVPALHQTGAQEPSDSLPRQGAQAAGLRLTGAQFHPELVPGLTRVCVRALFILR